MDAIQAINAAIQEEVGVEYSTQRKKANQSPYESMEQGKASCTGLSILLVNAFRSVGIPARIAGTPAWTTKPGNHNWVEIWTPADQAWHFTEYYPDAKGLDHGWLLADAARANADSLIHRIYATSWRRTDLFFPLVWNFRDRSVPAVNVTGRYLELGSHLVQEDACELRIHFTGGSGREAIPVRVMQGDAEVGRGMTPGPTDDLNRYLTLPVRKGQMYQIHWTDPESGQPRNRRVQTPQDETWLMLHLVEAASWMSVLPGDTLLSRLTIPGTHNAGALHEPFPGTAKCQDLSIAEQLAIGVRFLDIRCRWESGDFHIHHGPVDQKQRLADVLQTLYRFLQQQPGETVVMLLLPRDPERTLDGWLQREIEAQPQRWWQGEEIPHLQDCRGKIVLLRRFPSNLSVGLSAQPWRNNTSFQNPWLQVQDRYRPDSVEEKWQAMEEAFQLALDDTGGNRLHLNYSSGFLPGLMGIPSIAAVKERIHPALARYLLQTPATPLGCILLDFATPALVEQIFTANLQ
jgi:1-phosphatidylinositol phosphodiesterase